jgi:hypothetical protein
MPAYHLCHGEYQYRPGQACRLDGIERREQAFQSLAVPARIGRHQHITTLAQMKQNRAALEDRDLSIGQPRHLAEGLVRKMLDIPAPNGTPLTR